MYFIIINLDIFSDICIATERRKDKYVSEDKGEKERGEGRSSSSSSRRRHRSRSPRRRSTRERERFDRPERFSPPPPRLRGLPPMDPYRFTYTCNNNIVYMYM